MDFATTKSQSRSQDPFISQKECIGDAYTTAIPTTAPTQGQNPCWLPSQPRHKMLLELGFSGRQQHHCSQKLKGTEECLLEFSSEPSNIKNMKSEI
jgi:hypothetical protein